jgi:oligopeptide/dipeptide ABC transporter ATP-binding protein
MPLLSVKDLIVTFAAQPNSAKAVDGVSFSIESRQTVGLVGESGCGKTVTALSLLRLLPKKNLQTFSGTISLLDQDLMKCTDAQMRTIRGKKISMIFQEPMTSLNPVLTVGKQISEVLRQHKGQSRGQAKKTGLELLRKVSIHDAKSIWKAYPGKLSGGMRQRVMIAQAVAAEPDLLIADEPTTALDVTVQAQVLGLLDRLKTELGIGILLVTHDFGVVAEVCDRVCVMYAGRIIESAPVLDIFDTPLHPYTKGLLGSVRSLDNNKIESKIPGQVAPATNYPAGCRFHPRCPKVMEICRTIYPDTTTVRNSKVACHLFS